MKKNKSLKIGTRVKFQISNEIENGKAIIVGKDKDVDDGHYHYKLDVYEGSLADRHRNENKELWVNDFEVEKL